MVEYINCQKKIIEKLYYWNLIFLQLYTHCYRKIICQLITHVIVDLKYLQKAQAGNILLQF